MKKSILIFSSIFIVSFVLAFLFFTFYKPKNSTLQKDTNTSPTNKSFGQITLPKNEITDVKYNNALNKKTFPTSLPHYTMEKINTDDLSNVYTQKFNLGSPQKIDSTEGTIFLWNTDSGSYSLYTSPPKLVFVGNNIVDSNTFKNLRDDDIYEQTKNQIISLFKTDNAPALFYPYKIEYLDEQDNQPFYGIKKPNAKLAKVSFALKISNNTLYSFGATSVGATAIVDSKFNITKADLNIFPGLKLENNETNIITQNEAVEKLFSGQGKLATYKAGSDNQKGFIPIDFKETTVTNQELGYYFSPDSESLIPVYVFDGISLNSKTNQKMSTTSIVTALP